MYFLKVFYLSPFWLDGWPGNQYFWISHKISVFFTSLTTLDMHRQWFETDMSNSSYSEAVVVSKSLVHFLTQLRTLALCHFMAHYHFSSARAQEVLLSMRSIHATFLLRTSEHLTAVLSHNLMNVMRVFFSSD